MVSIGMCDKAPAIQNAFVDFKRTIALTTCYFHVVKNLKDIAGKKVFKDHYKADVQLLHLCPTKQHFKSLSKLIVAKWKERGDAKTVGAMNESYIADDRWNGWHIGALPHAGAGLTNNSLESFNKTIKQLAPQYTSMQIFNQQSIPAILKYIDDTTRVVLSGLNPIAVINLPTLMLHWDLVNATKRIIEGKAKNMLKSDGKWYVNTSKNRNNVKMTQKRINVHNEFNEASPPAATAKDFKSKYMSMHVVEKIVRPIAQHTEYICDCKHYMTYGVFCSHSLAAMHDDGAINFIHMFKAVEGPRGKGRPKKREALRYDVPAEQGQTPAEG